MSTFRVIQFNMQFGQIWDETYPDRAPIRLESTLEEIRSHNPDVILLQEVEKALRQPCGKCGKLLWQFQLRWKG